MGGPFVVVGASVLTQPPGVQDLPEIVQMIFWLTTGPGSAGDGVIARGIMMMSQPSIGL
jgi:hypothetical protein